MDVYLEVYDLVRIDSSTHRIDPPAGVIAYVASQQLKTNPFNGTEADIKGQLYSSRSKIDSSYLETARCMVAAAFKYRFEDMDDWDPVVFFDMVARAEKVLGRLAEPVSPNANKPLEVPESVKQEAMNRSRRKRRA